MVKKKALEIYAREINDEESLALFLKGQVEVGETWSDLQKAEAVRKVRGAHWLNGHMQFLHPLHRDWEWPMKR